MFGNWYFKRGGPTQVRPEPSLETGVTNGRTRPPEQVIGDFSVDANAMTTGTCACTDCTDDGMATSKDAADAVRRAWLPCIWRYRPRLHNHIGTKTPIFSEGVVPKLQRYDAFGVIGATFTELD